MSWSDEIISKLVEGNLESDALLEMQKAPKENERFDRVLAAEQKRVAWKDKIVLCLQEHLYIVAKKEDERVVKCTCGHEFGDYRKNWKDSALVYARDSEEKMEEIYRGPRKPDHNWAIIREFYCPGCGTQLEVESVMPHYPFVFNFLPDFEAWEKRRKG